MHPTHHPDDHHRRRAARRDGVEPRGPNAGVGSRPAQRHRPPAGRGRGYLARRGVRRRRGPLLRTKETAERLVDPLDYDLTDASYEAAWRERDIGVYQGLTYDDVFDRFPEFALGEAAVDAAGRVPDSGESLVDVYERVTGRFETILADADPEETRLVVTHGGPVYMLLAHVEDLDIKTATLDHHIDNCGVTVFEHSEGETRVVEKNGRSWDD